MVNNMWLYQIDIMGFLRRCSITSLIFVFFLLSASIGFANSDRIDQLLEILQTDKNPERGIALRELRQIGQPALQPLLNGLQDENYIYRTNMVIALENFKTPEVVGVLISVLKEN